MSGKIAGICNTIQIGKITTGRPVEEKRDKEKKKRQKNSYIKREQLPQPPAIPGSVDQSC